MSDIAAAICLGYPCVTLMTSSSGFPDANISSTASSSANVIHTIFPMKVIQLTIGVIGFLSNLFVVVVICMHRPMRSKPVNMFVINQSCIDAMVAVFLFTTTLFEDDRRPRTPGDPAGEAICRIWFTKIPLWGMLVSSNFAVVALTYEQYIALIHPMYHRTKFVSSRLLSIAIMTFTWIFGPAFALSYMGPTAGILPTGECTVYSIYPNQKTKHVVGVFVICIQYFLPLGLLAYAYLRMARMLHQRRRTENPDTDGQEIATVTADDSESVKRMRIMTQARNNVFKTLALVAALFVFCWTWNQIYFLMYNLGYQHSDFESWFYNFTVVMVFLNCFVNPIVYGLKYKKFQNAVLYAICRKKRNWSPWNSSDSVQPT